MQAILIAGGEGTRLRPFTLHTPKPLLHLCGRPVMEYQIDLIKHAGLKHVVFACGHLADQVRDTFGNGDRYGMHFQYAYEEELLGTGGAIRNCYPYLDGEATLVFNADVLTNLDARKLLEHHRRSKALVTLTLTPVADPSRYGVITTDESGRVTAFIEKPPSGTAPANTINAGMYVIESDVIRDIPAGRKVSVERETYPELLAAGAHVASFLNTGYWIDIGTAESFQQAHWDLLDGAFHGAPGAARDANGNFLAEPHRLPGNLTLKAPCFIDEHVTFQGPCTIGPYTAINQDCILAPNLTLERVIALPGARIESQPEPYSILGPQIESVV